MVERQLRRRGIARRARARGDGGGAARAVRLRAPRAPRLRRLGALPIGDEQTISQPWIVAAICQALELAGAERVLEIGTGSGYSTAILARLAAEVLSIERFAEPRRRGRGAPRASSARGQVEVRVGDGTLGAPEQRPVRRDRGARVGARRRRRACSTSSRPAAGS